MLIFFIFYLIYYLSSTLEINEERGKQMDEGIKGESQRGSKAEGGRKEKRQTAGG